MKKYIGCDLGGTNLRAAIVDVENGSVIHQMSIPTLARDGHDALMKRMAGLFLQIIEWAGMKKEDIGGVGIGVPGVLDLEKAKLSSCPICPAPGRMSLWRRRSPNKRGCQPYCLTMCAPLPMASGSLGRVEEWIRWLCSRSVRASVAGW